MKRYVKFNNNNIRVYFLNFNSFVYDDVQVNVKRSMLGVYRLKSSIGLHRRCMLLFIIMTLKKSTF